MFDTATYLSNDLVIKGPSPWIDVRAHGAVADGRADDTPAFQAAVDALPAAGRPGGPDGPKYGTVFVPPGDYRMASTVEIVGARHFALVGAPGAHLTWDGEAASPLFHLVSVRDSYVTSLSVTARAGRPLETAFRMETGREGLTTRIQFERINIDGTDGGVGKGFQTVAGVGRDANNDNHQFYNCEVSNTRLAAWSFEHSQSKGHKLISCNWNVDCYGDAGVATNLGPNGQGGSYVAIGCMGGGCNRADFQLGPPNDYIGIYNGNFESSRRFIYSPGSAAAIFPIVVLNTRWAADRLRPDDPADDPTHGEVITYGARGPLVLIGNLIGMNPLEKPELRIAFRPGEGIGSFTAIGNSIGTTLADPFGPVPPGISLGNIHYWPQHDRSELLPDCFNVLGAYTPPVGMPRGMTTKVTDGPPDDAPPDGTIYVDTTNSRLLVRSGGTWRSVALS
jgi:hypothetical protein